MENFIPSLQLTLLITIIITGEGEGGEREEEAAIAVLAENPCCVSSSYTLYAFRTCSFLDDHPLASLYCHFSTMTQPAV